MAKRRGGCCTTLHLKEENARFLLLAIVLIIYMVLGATIFYFLEKDEEERSHKQYIDAYTKFINKYQSVVNLTDLQNLLDEHGNATASGIIGTKPRWDYYGALYFVGTVVSTIGKT